MTRFEDILGTIRQAAEDEESWPAMLTDLADHLGIVEATLGGGTPGAMPHMIAPRTDPREIQRYFTTFHDRNLLMRDMMAYAPGIILLDEAMPHFEHFQRDAFYNEWCVPQRYRRALGVALTTSSGWRGALMVNASRAIEADQLARFEALLPVVARSLELSKLMGQFRSVARASLDVLELAGQGAMLLDGRGVLLECNASASRLFESGRLGQRHGRLRLAEPTADRNLARLIALCLQTPDHTAGGRMRAPTASGPLGLHCAPYPGGALFPAGRRPAVIVLVSDPRRRLHGRLQDLQRRYGLTVAEAGLALALLETGSRKAAAEARGVSDATARAQLTSIFDKTGIRRQTDLVRLLMAED